jgi:hypothetical protein
MYKTGGLEPDKDTKTLDIGGIKYVISEKFKTMLRDSLIDWGTFLEIYHNNIDYMNMFNQIIKMLNIQENENLRESLIPVVKKIYEMPMEVHMVAMIKQYLIYEPVSIAVHELFTTIKTHFEKIVILYINTRNEYIIKNHTGDKHNHYEKLYEYWSDLNNRHNFDTSSIVLFFINPPTREIDSGIKFNIEGKMEKIKLLKKDLRKFHYAGYCPKVPYSRLKKLLSFPIDKFIEVIHDIDNKTVFPNYTQLESIISDELKNISPKPNIPDDYVRKELPTNLTTDVQKAKWYVDEILELRKLLMPYGKSYEDHYNDQAKAFININNKFIEHFSVIDY